KKHPEVIHMLTDLGKKSDIDLGANMASMLIQLVDEKDRNIGLQDMISVFVKELSDIPDARIQVDIASGMGGPGAPVQLFLMGQDLEKLEELKNEFMDKIKDVYGLI